MSGYTSEHLVLRDFREADVPMVFRLLSDEQVLRFTTQSPMTMRGAERFVENARFKKFEFAIDHDGVFVGRSFIHITEKKNKTAEIGYLLLPDFWNKGFATETVKRLLTFGFDELGLQRIFGTCNPENIYSARAMEKNGMKLERIIKKHKWNKRTKMWRDSMIWAMSKEQWQQAHSR